MSSKLYEKYIDLKNVKKDIVYLLNSGMFYIAIDEDAKLLNEKIYLKLTKLTTNILKVGFPTNKLEEYKKRLDFMNIKYETVEIQTKTYNSVLNELRCIDINSFNEEELKRNYLKITRKDKRNRFNVGIVLSENLSYIGYLLLAEVTLLIRLVQYSNAVTMVC